MVNTNIQGPIPLIGRGYTSRKDGIYSNGEYPKLENVEIDDLGRLVNRRPFATLGAGTSSPAWQFVGIYKDNPILMSDNQCAAVGPTGFNYSVDNTDVEFNLPAIGPGTHYNHTIRKIFRYNGRTYFLTLKHDGLSAYNFYVLHSAKVNPAWADLTVVGPVINITVPTDLVGIHKPDVMAAGIFKERLWIATKDTVYFSKATDPSIFTVPDGGFFTWPDQTIKNMLFTRDTIYVMRSDGISAITYSDDPNQDSTVRVISDVLGADCSCIFEDTVHFIRDDTLYSITNGNVNKIDKLYLKWPDTGIKYRAKLESMGKYLVLHLGTVTPFASNRGNADIAIHHHPRMIDPYLFFINMENGAIHTVRPAAFSYDDGYQAKVIDMIMVPNDGDNTHPPYMYFLIGYSNSTLTSPGDVAKEFAPPPTVGVLYNYWANVGFMSSVVDDYLGIAPGWDQLEDIGASGDDYRPHSIKVQTNYTPDGTHALMKKFREMHFEGVFPEAINEGAVKLYIGYDSRSEVFIRDLEQDESFETVPRGPYSFRFGLNQRARGIDILIESEFTEQEYFLPQNGRTFMISDLRILWTYLQRGRQYAKRIATGVVPS